MKQLHKEFEAMDYNELEIGITAFALGLACEDEVNGVIIGGCNDRPLKESTKLFSMPPIDRRLELIKEACDYILEH